jgi:3-oxoacyl-[acyl-carrier protein] reductase
MYADNKIAALVMTDVRQEPLEVTAADIEKKYHVKTLPLAGDLTKEASDADIVKKAAQQFGHVDILVNCAGISRQGTWETVTEAHWDMTFAINVKGLFFMCREVMKQMQTQTQGGCIINLASQAGRHGGIVVEPDYASSKAAILTLTKSLAKAGAAKTIRVNTISPGLIATEMTKTFGYDPKTVPLGRIGTGDDVAGAALFLASDYASYITGASIDVNGGISMI